MVKKMEAAELKMVRWALRVTLKNKVRNEYIWGTAKIRGKKWGKKKKAKNWGKAEGRETEMVWACAEKRRKLHRQNNDEN